MPDQKVNPLVENESIHKFGGWNRPPTRKNKGVIPFQGPLKDKGLSPSKVFWRKRQFGAGLSILHK